MYDAQGNKTSNLAIVYTPASNLRKSADMAVGQVRCCCLMQSLLKSAAHCLCFWWLAVAGTEGPALKSAVNRYRACCPCFTPWLPPPLQVGFHNDKLVKKAQVARRLNEIVNRLNKTQVRRGWRADYAAAAEPSLLLRCCCCRSSCWCCACLACTTTSLAAPAALPYSLGCARLTGLVRCNALLRCSQEERFPDLAAERAAWEKEQAGKRKQRQR